MVFYETMLTEFLYIMESFTALHLPTKMHIIGDMRNAEKFMRLSECLAMTTGFPRKY